MEIVVVAVNLTPVARSFGSAHNKKLEHKMDISTEELVSLIDETACMLRSGYTVLAVSRSD